MAEETATPHLWEVEHPYYCTRGNFHATGMHAHHTTWGHFMESGAQNWDLDMDLVFRWDWDQPEEGVLGELNLYVVQQRKGRNFSVSVTVHPDEEPLVRAWLIPRLEMLKQMWLPLS